MVRDLCVVQPCDVRALFIQLPSEFHQCCACLVAISAQFGVLPCPQAIARNEQPSKEMEALHELTSSIRKSGRTNDGAVGYRVQLSTAPAADDNDD
jgi:hypothetical protein